MSQPAYLSPIDTRSLSAAALATLARGRDIYIWGGAFVGGGVWKALTRNGLAAAGFLDSSPRFHGRKLRGLNVFKPDEILGRPGARQSVFIITASGHWEGQLQEGCRRAGLIEGEDFISFNDLTPIQPAVEISGLCNLRCQGCPRGNMDEHPPAGFMSAETYTEVLNKLLREIPLLGSVQLYTWGEPLLNPAIYEILAESRRRDVLTVISTNLNFSIDLARLVEAGPGLMRLSASGCGADYEKTHTGGHWERFEANFWSLAKEMAASKADFEVELYYHLYRHNQGRDFQRLKDMAAEAGFTFRPILGCLYPWDNIEKIITGQGLSEAALRHLELIGADLPAIIDEAAQNPLSEPCTQVRCFPIDWDLRLLGCGGWYLPRLDVNFLETPLAEMVKAKMESELCRRCAARGIHRVNFPFMADQAAIGS
ncbi:hypothetical protein C4J81_18670 (plasmid) [Deltaproteobacteria bacterium Smac51]|nr:hypothetical protein C4J81_18670 [Deltaproteobacteria bacterium Smac51]